MKTFTELKENTQKKVDLVWSGSDANLPKEDVVGDVRKFTTALEGITTKNPVKISASEENGKISLFINGGRNGMSLNEIEKAVHEANKDMQGKKFEIVTTYIKVVVK